MLHTLLLSNNYEFLRFLSEERAILLLTKNKTEILSEWDQEVIWSSGRMKLPATLRLTYQIRRFHKEPNFHKNFIFRRDQYLCQYCNAALTRSEATIDHIIPKSRGGCTSWENCITACFTCNTIIKGNNLPEEVGLKLKRAPVKPKNRIFSDVFPTQYHKDWEYYLGGRLL